jgi:hypothetical protein
MDDMMCALYGNPSRPRVCIDFKPDPDFCGNSREEAMRILYSVSV